MNAREAIAAAVEGPREIAVISQRSAQGDALVTVQDSGTGIAPSDLGRIFDSFFTTKPTGMGMGLSISRSIIEAHGGRISAALNEGRGLKVEFTLPAAVR